MTLRQFYAAQALPAILAEYTMVAHFPETNEQRAQVTRRAFAIADAMIAEEEGLNDRQPTNQA